MRVIDLLHLGTERVIATYEVDGVLIDPGPEPCVGTLEAALGEHFEPRAILLTHIHLDHAGATGALLRRWPEVPVYVHERGARHIAHPEKLVASAARLYGEEGMRRLWGDVIPVPEERLHVLGGGETVLGDYRVAYTPGHASHHVSYLHEPSGRAFVGDVAGIRIAPSVYVIAPTPPPDLDVAAWEASIDLLEEWAPQGLGLTHFGTVEPEDVEAQLSGVRAALQHEVALASDHDLDAFVAAMREELRHQALPLVEAYAQAAPLDHLWLGLDRWRTKLADAGSA